MSELWRQFVDLLLRKGYTISDLSFCTEDVFRSLLRETGFTSPRVVDQLMHEWQHHLENVRSGGKMYTSATGKSICEIHLPELTQYKTHDIALMAMQLLQRHASVSLQKKITVRESQVETITSWTSTFANKVLTSFAHVVANMPNSEIKLLWKLCSPATIAKVEQMLSIDNSSDADSLCSSGIVLYDANKPITRLNTLSVSESSDDNFILAHLAQFAESGWGLVAFDVAPGLSRVIHSTELKELSKSFHRFTMSECYDMLKEAHFDSFVIPAVGATIICNTHQLLPRYVVYFSVEYASNNVISNVAMNTFSNSSAISSAEAELTAPYQLQTEQGRARQHLSPRQVVNHAEQKEQLQEREQWESVLREHQDKDKKTQQEYSLSETQQESTLARNANTSPKLINTKSNKEDKIVYQPNEVYDINSNNEELLESSSVMCAIHPQKRVEFWSPSEHRLLCSLCLYFDGYSRSNCVPIDQAVREQVPKLQRWLQNARTFQQEVSGVFELFQAATDDVVRNEQEIVDSVKQEFRNIHVELEELEKKICNECHLHSIKQQQQMQLASDEVSATVEEVNELVQQIDKPLSMYKRNIYSRSKNNNYNIALESNVNMQIEQTNMYAKLLQGAQSAFRKWTQVELPSYVLLERTNHLLSAVHDVLRSVNVNIASRTCKGNVELPGAIDVNSLCDSVEL